MRLNPFARRPRPAPPDPRAFFDQLVKVRLGERYDEADRWRDFRAVFLGQSGPEQGNRVLWQILEWTRMYQRVAAPGVTIVDDGTLPDRRGSLSVDDEGTPSQRNVLIEDGILVGYMQDRMNARLMGLKATGNGRREFRPR